MLLPIIDYLTKLSVYLWFFPYALLGNSSDLEKLVKYNLDGVTPDM